MASQNFFQDNADGTKIVAIDPSSITTATTRTITMPDNDVLLVNRDDIAEVAFDPPRKTVAAPGAAITWSLSEGTILELTDVANNVTVTVTDDRVGGTGDRLEVNQVTVVVKQDSLGGNIITLAGGIVGQCTSIDSAADSVSSSYWLRALTTGTPANDWIEAGGSGTGGVGIYPYFSQTGGSTATIDLDSYQYGIVTLDQDMVLTISNPTRGLYGAVKVIQDGTGGHTLTVSGATLIGKVDEEANAITHLDLSINADASAHLISKIDEKSGINDLGAIGGSVTIELDEGTSDNKKLTLNANLTPTFNATRSGLYRFVVIQNATGGWEITWPASVKYYGVAPQPNSDPLSLTAFSLFFDGTYFHIV